MMRDTAHDRCGVSCILCRCSPRALAWIPRTRRAWRRVSSTSQAVRFCFSFNNEDYFHDAGVLMSERWKKAVLTPDQTMEDALKAINAGGLRIAFVVDSSGKILG